MLRSISSRASKSIKPFARASMARSIARTRHWYTAPMEINGMAHVILTVRNFPAARDFYGALLPYLGLKPVVDSPEYFYCIGGRTALGLRPASAELAKDAFDQGRSGLHHLCFRARSREDVDSLHSFLVARGAKIVH